MKYKKLLLLSLLGANLMAFSQSEDLTNTLVEEESSTDISNSDSIIQIDTVLTKEAVIFNEDSKKINDSLSAFEEKNQKKEILIIDSTQAQRVYFVKEFIMEEGKVYHYVIFDAQHHQPLLHLPQSKKKRKIVYEDDLLKLEMDGAMKLYSIISSEKIIGSLESFKKVYYTAYKGKLLRVDIHGAGNHFFKDFEKMYYGNNRGRLDGQRFKKVEEIVVFFNKNLPK